FYSRFAIRQPMRYQRQITNQLWVSRHGIVRIRVEPVVDGIAIARPQMEVTLNYRRPATIGKDKVILRDQLPERVLAVALHPAQSRRGIHIPKRYPRALAAKLWDGSFQKIVVRAHAAVLDHQVGRGRFYQHSLQVAWSLIDQYLCVINFFRVPMTLSLINIRLGEADTMSQRVQRFINAAIIRRRAIPI